MALTTFQKILGKKLKLVLSTILLPDLIDIVISFGGCELFFLMDDQWLVAYDNGGEFVKIVKFDRLLLNGISNTHLGMVHHGMHEKQWFQLDIFSGITSAICSYGVTNIRQTMMINSIIYGIELFVYSSHHHCRIYKLMRQSMGFLFIP